jgi:hypothetical protein
MALTKEDREATQFRTGAEQVETARKGGVASGKVRKEKKALKETLEWLLNLPIKDGKATDTDKIKNIAQVKGKNITMQEAIMLSMLQKAARGDVRAAEFIRDTIGQKPDGRMSIDMQIPVIFEGEESLE